MKFFATDYVLIENKTGKMVRFTNSDEVVIYGDLAEAKEDAKGMDVVIVSTDKLNESDKEILRKQLSEE